MPKKLKHILWINDKANFLGGAEHYIYNSVKILKSMGIESTLLYDVNEFTDTEFLNIFDNAFPLIDIDLQIKDFDIDIIYIHQISDIDKLESITKLNIKSVKFIHDHKILCLREHKYKTLSLDTCKETIGLNCYSCLGFINRSDSIFKIKLSTISNLQKIQNINKKLDKIIVASKYLKNHLIEHNFDKSKIDINRLFFEKKDSIVFDKTPNSNKILFVGQLVRGKGLDILIKTMSELPSLHLDIVGSGVQEIEYKNLVKELNLSSRITFHSSLTHEELIKFYKDALALIMPSRAPETFGLSGLEAISYSLPVVASDVGGISEWLIDGKSGVLSKSNDHKSLKDAINKIMDKNIQKRIRESANMIYSENFLPKHHMKNLIESFEKLINGSIEDRGDKNV